MTTGVVGLERLCRYSDYLLLIQNLYGMCIVNNAFHTFKIVIVCVLSLLQESLKLNVR